MTQKQHDIKEHDLKMLIADRFKDIQLQSNALQDVDDRGKVLQTLTKISDFIAEIQRTYSDLDDLDFETIEKEETENDYVSEQCKKFSSYAV